MCHHLHWWNPNLSQAFNVLYEHFFLQIWSTYLNPVSESHMSPHGCQASRYTTQTGVFSIFVSCVAGQSDWTEKTEGTWKTKGYCIRKAIKQMCLILWECLQMRQSLQHEHKPVLHSPVWTFVPYPPAPGWWVTTGFDISMIWITGLYLAAKLKTNVDNYNVIIFNRKSFNLVDLKLKRMS